MSCELSDCQKVREHRLANKADVTNGLCLRKLEMLRNLRLHTCMSKAKTVPRLLLRRDGKAKDDLTRAGQSRALVSYINRYGNYFSDDTERQLWTLTGFLEHLDTVSV